MKKEINVLNDCRNMYNEEIIDTIMQSRGIKNVEEFLNPSLSNIMSPNELYRMDEAVGLTISSLKENKKFLVHADTDCDGITSGSIVIRYLKYLGLQVDYCINKGKQHGTSDVLFNKIEEYKPDVLIIVDSLDSDIQNYKKIKELGIKTIILDHHDISVDLELDYDDSAILVSSNRCYENNELSGVGVSYKFCKALENELGTCFVDRMVDLVCTGLLADMMSMDEEHMENRAFVNWGLTSLNNSGIKKIVGGYNFNSTSVSFSIAPLVNAAVRYNENEVALELLLSDDNKEILKCMKILKNCKERQNEDVSLLMPDILEQIEAQENNKMIVVVIESEYGIAGLIGNRLLDLVQKPILVLKEGKNGYSGSARSIGCGDFKSMCENTELCSVGGHSEAFGIEIYYDKFDLFRERIEEELSSIEFKEEKVIDVELDEADVNDDLLHRIMEIDRISGQGFPQISFKIEIDNYEVSSMSQGKHLVLKTPNMSFIKWNFSGDWEELEDAGICNSAIECYGTLQAGYIGRTYMRQMILSDFNILN